MSLDVDPELAAAGRNVIALVTAIQAGDVEAHDAIFVGLPLDETLNTVRALSLYTAEHFDLVSTFYETDARTSLVELGLELAGGQVTS